MKKIGLMVLTALVFVACGSSDSNNDNTTPSDSNNNGTLAQETMEKLQGTWAGVCEVDGNSSEQMMLTISNLNLETDWKMFDNKECNSTDLTSHLTLRGELTIGDKVTGLNGEDAVAVDTLFTGFTQRSGSALTSPSDLGIGEKSYGSLMFKGENQIVSADESTGRDGKTAEKREIDFSNGEVLTKVVSK
jgi:hypothetical protein